MKQCMLITLKEEEIRAVEKVYVEGVAISENDVIVINAI